MVKRTQKSIILEYLLYGYDPEEIAEIEGFKRRTVENVIYYEVAKYKWYRTYTQKRNHLKRLKLGFSDNEMDYGATIMFYGWSELSFTEKRLSCQEDHHELKQFKYEKENK